MINWIKQPVLTPVSTYVECYWFLDKTTNDKSDQQPKLNPDPCGHLILSPPLKPYSYTGQQEEFKGVGTHWLFPYASTIELNHQQAFVHLGIKFRAGALYSVCLPNYQHPLIETVEHTSLASVLTEQTANETKLIELARSNPQQCTTALDKLLEPWLSQNHEDKHTRLVRKILPLVPTMAINKLSEQVFCSQRTLERSFVRVTGFTLKQYQAMDKLERMLAYLYQREHASIDWLTVAYQFGFSDQPHLIRYLKKQLGHTPNSYAQIRDFTIDVYGGVEPTEF